MRAKDQQNKQQQQQQQRQYPHNYESQQYLHQPHQQTLQQLILPKGFSMDGSDKYIVGGFPSRSNDNGQVMYQVIQAPFDYIGYKTHPTNSVGNTQMTHGGSNGGGVGTLPWQRSPPAISSDSSAGSGARKLDTDTLATSGQSPPTNIVYAVIDDQGRTMIDTSQFNLQSPQTGPAIGGESSVPTAELIVSNGLGGSSGDAVQLVDSVELQRLILQNQLLVQEQQQIRQQEAPLHPQLPLFQPDQQFLQNGGYLQPFLPHHRQQFYYPQQFF